MNDATTTTARTKKMAMERETGANGDDYLSDGRCQCQCTSQTKSCTTMELANIIKMHLIISSWPSFLFVEWTRTRINSILSTLANLKAPSILDFESE